MSLKQRSVLPGFGLTMGCTLSYLSLLVLIPLAGLFLKSATIGWADFWDDRDRRRRRSTPTSSRSALRWRPRRSTPFSD